MPPRLQMVLDRTEGRSPERVELKAEARHLVLTIPPPRIIGQPPDDERSVTVYRLDQPQGNG